MGLYIYIYIYTIYIYGSPYLSDSMIKLKKKKQTLIPIGILSYICELADKLNSKPTVIGLYPKCV